MLYDPKWEKQTETRADPLQLGTLIAWLEKQPGETAYDYGCNGGCLLALYFQAHGFTGAMMGSVTFWWVDKGQQTPILDLPNGFNVIARQHPRTFGAALERARAVA